MSGNDSEDQARPFTYSRGKDGVDETWDVWSPEGEHLVSIPFWDESERTEAIAQMITNALNVVSGLGGEADVQKILQGQKRIAQLWSIQDVQKVNENLTDEQAWVALQAIDLRQDAQVGITWDLIEQAASEVQNRYREISQQASGEAREQLQSLFGGKSEGLLEAAQQRAEQRQPSEQERGERE